MAGGYEYGNTRLRAQYSRRLRVADYRRMLDKSRIEEVMTALTETPYKADVEAALLRARGVSCIVLALQTNLSQALQTVKSYYEGEPRWLIELRLRHWDRHNLLTILRGQRHQAAPEDVLAAVVPVGEFDAGVLRELALQPGLRAAVDLIRTWRLPYAEVFRRLAAQADPLADLAAIEHAVTQDHYATLLQALAHGDANRTLLRHTLRVEIDLINLSMTLRLARQPELARLAQRRYQSPDVRPLFIEPGGYLTVPRLVDIATMARNMGDVMQALQTSRYGTALAAGWERLRTGAGDISVIERELERWQARRTAALFTQDPLSLAIPLAYIGSKETEVANVRLIAQAVDLELDRERVWHDLILPD